MNEIELRWRAAVSDAELVGLTEAHGGRMVTGWWDRVSHHSLGWVTARRNGALVGFVNVAWDGGDHAFLLDTKTVRIINARASAPLWSPSLRPKPDGRVASGCTSTSNLRLPCSTWTPAASLRRQLA